MAAQHRDRLAIGGIPHPERLIVRCRHEAPPIRAEGDLVDPPRMPPQDLDRPARGPVPEPHRLVQGRRGEPRPIGTERQPLDLVLVPGRHGPRRPGRRVPQADGAVRGLAARGDELAVGAVGERMEARLRPAQGRHLLPRLRVPEAAERIPCPAEAIRRPSGLKAMARMVPVWPRRTAPYSGRSWRPTTEGCGPPRPTRGGGRPG